MSNPVLMSDFTKKLIEQQKQAQANTQNANQTQIQQQTLNTQASQQQNQNVQLDNSSATTEIKEPQIQQVEKTLPAVDMSAPKDTLDLSTKLEKAKKQNGLIEKVADKVKGLTGIGISSKSIEEKIKSGASEEEIAKDIKNYKRQQENTAQALVDMLICLGSVVLFTKAKNNTLLTAFKAKISGNGFGNKVNERMMATIGASIGAGYLGAIFKPMLLGLNRIGTEQYKVKKDENIDDDQYKILKNATRKEKANANFRNTISGALNGLATPLVTLGGGFIGAPLYVLFNSLNRYFVATKEDSGEKSVGSYVENLKGSPITNLVAAIPVLALAFKKGNYSAIYDKNLRKAFTNINNAGALESFSDGKTTYEKLAEVLKGSEEFRRITATDVDETDSLSGIMNRVSRYVSSDELADKMYEELSQNTFFLKILQIQEDEIKITETLAEMFTGDKGDSVMNKLVKKLKMDGPRTYTSQEVTQMLQKTFNGKYSLVDEDPLGVGTVAETYLVKDKEGKEFVVKFLKKGIDPKGEKILADAKKCEEIIRRADISEQEKAVLLNSFEDIAKGVVKEADLKHEMEAAEKLAKTTSLAKVAKGVEVSEDGTAYVMEKAQGHCLQKVSDYIEERNRLTREVQQYTRAKNAQATGGKQSPLLGCFKEENVDESLKKAQEKLAKFDEKHKGMEGFASLSNDEARTMLELYQDVLVEQFNKVDPNGKTIHADIHPGNIMIDISQLKAYAAGEKAARANVFTLIDTGNTIEQAPEVAIRFLNLSKYIENADVDNIVNFVLEGATLPSGKIYTKAANVPENVASKEEMDKYFKIIRERLAGADGKSGIFFDSKTGLNKLTNQALVEDITNKLLNEAGIIPSNTQGNLIKAQTSAKNSLKQFRKNNGKTLFKNLTSSGSSGGGIMDVIKTFKNGSGYRAKQRKQEKMNLRKLPAMLRSKTKASKNAPKKNSVEYLTYLLKQDKIMNEKAEDTLDTMEILLDSMY